ncbi:MAG: asparagine synthase (glutamine-hydrolyzing) [Planctomyces sp.]|nr:asparagine synthase (glutamine-hydrolyzing) [Planctomyces sp.]
MCGIAGAAWTERGLPLPTDALARMTAAIAHRGPDDSGDYWSADSRGAQDGAPTRPGCALGFRRLSIIDLAAGHQPLSNEDGSVWIVFNGEIYNYRELRQDLEARGHRFSTHTDTETIVHLYEEHGIDCVRRLRGMFALALWDAGRQRLLLARDRIGKKPLFYTHADGRLVFASELKSLLQLADIPREVDPEAVDLYLTYQYVPHPRSILKGVHKLSPGHVAVFERGALDVRRYWRPPYDDADAGDLADPALQECRRWSAADWTSHLRRTLTDAVRLRMRSDVPIGAFLSGGIDSTITAGLMQSLSDRPILTFSIGFPIPQFDERRFARDAAQRLGTEHHEYVVEPSALESLPRLSWHYDEPFGDSSAIPTMYLAEVTRRQVTVSLSGDGGDELFAGYDRYEAVRLARLADRLPQFLRNVFGWGLWQKIPTSSAQMSFGRRAKRFLGGLSESPERRYLKWVGMFDRDRRQDLYTPEFRRRIEGFDSGRFLLDCYAMCVDRDFVTRTTCADLLSYLPCDILTKVDIASMAHSLEVRCPFLDHHVVELAARMPIELKQRGGRGKRILIDAFGDLLPQSIQDRPKMGFGVPIDHWFRNELRDLVNDILLDSRAVARGYFRPEAVRRLIGEHQSGRWDHSYRLWTLICFEQWHRNYIDAALPSLAPAA